MTALLCHHDVWAVWAAWCNSICLLAIWDAWFIQQLPKNLWRITWLAMNFSTFHRTVWMVVLEYHPSHVGGLSPLLYTMCTSPPPRWVVHTSTWVGSAAQKLNCAIGNRFFTPHACNLSWGLLAMQAGKTNRFDFEEVVPQVSVALYWASLLLVAWWVQTYSLINLTSSFECECLWEITPPVSIHAPDPHFILSTYTQSC